MTQLPDFENCNRAESQWHLAQQKLLGSDCVEIPIPPEMAEDVEGVSQVLRAEKAPANTDQESNGVRNRSGSTKYSALTMGKKIANSNELKSMRRC